MAAAEEEHDCNCPPKGAPMWIVTFSDLMSLMLTFFVLLLSFSEIDAQKFKTATGSIRLAFGVQRELVREDIPLGTSIVAEEYSKGEPTVLDFDLPPFATSDTYALERRRALLLQEDMSRIFKKNMSLIRANLAREIEQGLVKVSNNGYSARIEVSENLVFVQNTDQVKRSSAPVLQKIARTLQKVQGEIRFEGHTEKGFEGNSYFRNPWELTAAQAAALGNLMSRFTDLPDERFLIQGFGASKVGKESTREDRRAVIEIGIDPKVMQKYDY